MLSGVFHLPKRDLPTPFYNIHRIVVDVKTAVPSIVLFAVTVACMALSLFEDDMLMAAVLAFPMAASVILMAESRRWVVPVKVPLLCAAACIFSTLMCIYVLNWTEDTDISQSLYSHIEGLVLWLVTFTSAILTVAAVATAADAVFNRVLAGSLTIFVSIGSMTLVWVFLSVFFDHDVDSKYTFSMEMAYLFVNGVASLLTAIAVSKGLRGRHWRFKRFQKEGSE